LYNNKIMTKKSVFILAIFLFCSWNIVVAQKFQSENLFYVTNSQSGIKSFQDHASQISIIVPASYNIDQYGVIAGEVDSQVLIIANQNKVKVMPIVASFDQKGIHHLLNDSDAIQRAIQMMVEIGKANHFYGWQFDFENISFLDATAYTNFYQKAANALHENGLKISMAIVKAYYSYPAPGDPAYNRWIYENWKGAFQIKKLADIGDFISFMTYDEHTALTPPGPVAGLPWMNQMAQYLENIHVPMDKVSFGIPTYSDHWFPTWDETQGAHSTRSEISYQSAERLLEKNHAVLHWMPDQGVAYAYWAMPNGVFNWLFLEDARSFTEKLKLIPKYGFRGISVWLLGEEDTGIWKILNENTEATH
ncbi:MAG: glycosyl hydrolase family 18 protein, partial [Chitinophagaceae bacterium]